MGGRHACGVRGANGGGGGLSPSSAFRQAKLAVPARKAEGGRENIRGDLARSSAQDIKASRNDGKTRFALDSRPATRAEKRIGGGGSAKNARVRCAPAAQNARG